MNFQEGRTTANSNAFQPQSQYRPIPPSFQMRPGNQHSQYGSQRQLNIPNNIAKPTFNLKEISFQSKEYYRPPQSTTTAPLTFNLVSPVKAKMKKPHRPISKVTKSFANPFTKQLEDEFFKEEHNRVNIANLEDCSKTASTFIGQSFLNSQQMHTQPSLENLYTPSKPYADYDHNRSLQNVHSLQNFLKKNDSQSRIFNNSNSYTNINSGYHYQHEVSSARQRDKQQTKDKSSLMNEIKTQRETIEALQSQVGRLNQEIRVWRMGEGSKKEMDLRSSRKENKIDKRQYELQCEQNSKLLAQIQEMEREMKGNNELHKYLEQQCNLYLDNYNKIHQEFETYKKDHLENKQKNDQIIDILKKQTKDLELEIDSFRTTDKSLREEIIQLRKNMQLQSERIAQQSTNYNIDRSQINVLTTKLQNLQGKYEKLMHSLCENQLKFHKMEEERQLQRNQLDIKIKEAQKRQLQAVRYNEDLLRQIIQIKNDKLKVSNENAEIKSTLLQKSSYFQSQYDNANEEVKEARRVLQEKTAKVHELNFKVEWTLQEKKEKQKLLIELQEKYDKLQRKNQQYLQNIQQKEKSVERYKSEYERVHLQYSNIESQYDHLQKTNQQIQNDIASKNEELKQLTGDISLLHLQIKQFQRKDVSYKNTTLELQSTQKRLDNLERSYFVLKAKLAQKQEIVSQHSSCQDKHKQFNKRLKQLQQQLSQLKQQLAKNEKLQNEYEMISHQNKTFKAMQQKLLESLQEKDLILSQYSSDLQALKQSAEKLQSQNTKHLKQYSLLKENYQAQSLHYKQIQSHLIQNEFNYTILQRQFNQYLVKYKQIQEECQNVRHLNTELESSLRDAIGVNERSMAVIQGLQMQDDGKGKDESMLEELRDVREVYERRIEGLQREKEKIENEMKLLLETHEIELKKAKQRCEQANNKYVKTIQQLSSTTQKFISLSQDYQNQQRQNLKLSSCLQQKEKELVQKQQSILLSLSQIKSLKAQVQTLQETIQHLQNTIQLYQSKQLALKQQITSLMLIIEQNQKRHYEETSELKETITRLTQQYQSEDQENKKVIDELKETVLALHQKQNIKKQEELQTIDQQNQPQKIEILNRQWQSQTFLRQDDSEDPSIQLPQFLSANDLPQEITYIQMDRQGITYLCQLLQINPANGNILNQIVMKVQTHLTELSLTRRTVQSYRKLLDTFGIQEGPSCDDLLTQEITSFKENLTIVIEKLQEQECQHQALKNQYHHLAIVKDAEMMKNQRYMHDISILHELNEELNQVVFKLTASLCNMKMQITEAFKIAKEEDTNSCCLIKSEKFVTVKSFPRLPSDNEFQDL